MLKLYFDKLLKIAQIFYQMYNVLYMIKDHKKMMTKLGDIAMAVFLVAMFLYGLAQSAR